MNEEANKTIISDLKRQIDMRGISSLSDEKLLAIILRESTGGRDILRISKAILERFSLQDLTDIPGNHVLSKINGLTEDSLVTIRACCELYNRINRAKKENNTIQNAEDIYNLLRNEMIHYKKEYFRAISVNSNLEIIGTEDVSIGSADKTPAHPREVFRSAIAHGAHGIFLAHNHPSDNPSPSIGDITVTEKLRESGKIIGIRLIDHIIITSKGYYSFNTGKTVFAGDIPEI